MPYDREERDAEARKLDALVAIGTAVGALSANLTAMFQENTSQTSLLKQVDRKLDLVMDSLGIRGIKDDAGK